LVLDEPTNGLDIPSKAIFRKVMAGTLDEDQLVLISTHQVKDIENLIDNVVILDDGKVILQKDLHAIAAELSFENSKALDSETTLYGEPSPGGFRIIKRQVNGNTSVDIELLFNAVTKGSKLFIHE
jgi:ABC-2 type transport system ATP-binding protein